MIIGIDFDNTIVEYTALFRGIALEKGWVGDDVPFSKKEVRDRIRLLPDGEMLWRDLQALVYGPRILEAKAFEGVDVFFRQCINAGHELHIVSHKTNFAANDREQQCNLRDMAGKWLEANGFVADGRGLSPSQVHFADTRNEKVFKVEELGCAVFVDDLIETFEEAAFPDGVDKYLFAPGGEEYPDFPGKVVRAWSDIIRAVLGEKHAV